MTSIAGLSREDRLKLMKFVCSFAWTDLKVVQQERDLVQRMSTQLDLDDDERQQIATWLELPPSPEDVDPAEVPLEHRRLFVNAARVMVHSDGNVARSERDSLALFERLLD